MKFTAEQIDIARRLKRLSLPWVPSVGHYVYDEQGICPKSSPFQDRVYFLLNFDCFMDHVGGQDRFEQCMVWLPTWHDCRILLQQLGVANTEVALLITSAIARDDELTTLYKMLEDVMISKHAKSAGRPTSSERV